MSLCIESSYSFNGSLICNKSLNSIEKYGYDTLGLVDTNTSFFVSFYKILKSKNIKPIFGLRVKSNNFDFVLYPKNFNGYSIIVKFASCKNEHDIVSLSNLPISNDVIYVIDIKNIKYSNLVELDESYNYLNNLNLLVYVSAPLKNDIFKFGIYETIKNKYKLLIFDEVSYLNKNEKKAHLVLLSIFKIKSYSEENLFDNDSLLDKSLDSYNDFLFFYKDYKELLDNYNEFKALINIELEFKNRIPIFKNNLNISSKEYLKRLAFNGLEKRLRNTNKNKNVYIKRLEYELEIIDKMGFNDYFLIVYDYVKFAKLNGILVGPGRGSAASSLVSYSLYIIEIDPVEYNLIFERFLNPNRSKMPDIDVDFEKVDRKRVIDYVIDKYSISSVSYMTIYKTLTPGEIINELSKILDSSPQLLNFISKIFKEFEGNKEIEKILLNEEYKRYYSEDEEFKNIIDLIITLNGIPNMRVIHPSGIIVSNEEYENYSEFMINSDGNRQSLIPQDDLESLGFLKMDFLSKVEFSFIKKILEEINRNYNIKLNIYNINLNDKKTYNMLSQGLTDGIPHLNTPLNTSTCVNMKISSIRDIYLLLGINRPGPMKYKNLLLDVRFKRRAPILYDPSIDEILKETYGVIIFQEQVMMISNRYAGLTLSESDYLLKAITSKNESIFNSIQNKFIDGANRLNRNLNVTNRIFNDIKEFCNYGFNKAHSVAYSYLAYIFAYLKANFPLEFFSVLFDGGLTPRKINESIYMNLELVPPDLRFSTFEYSSKNGKIYMPLPKVGDKDKSKVLELIKNSNYSFEKFVSLSKDILNRSEIETLIFSGAFDYTTYTKLSMVESLDGLLEFDTSLISDLTFKVDESKEEYDFETLRIKEHDAIKVNLKYHPIKNVKGNYKKISNCNIGDRINILGFITGLRETKTKAGDLMATMSISDEYLSVDAVMYPMCYNSCRQFLKNNTLYLISGNYELNNRDGKAQVKINKIKEL